MLRKKLGWLIRPKSAFKVGDTVQLKAGGHELMVVIEVINKRGMRRILLNCQWYELATKQTRTNLFPEEHVRPYNWDESDREKPTTGKQRENGL